MLTSRLGTFEGLIIADLFAGTGALGLEALSRGAGHCTFVEQDRTALEILRRNLAALGAQAKADVRSSPLQHASPPRLPCDLILIDPPYGTGMAQQALARVAEPGWLAPGGYVSLEYSREEIAIPDGLSLEAERSFGKARLLILRSGPA